MVNEGVRRAYTHPDNAPCVPLFWRTPPARSRNTRDNTPAVIHTRAGPRRHSWMCSVAAKGGGSENKAKLVMLNPFRQYCRLGAPKHVPTMGAGWCPPGMLGIGIGGTAEKAAVMAKEVADGPHRYS